MVCVLIYHPALLCVLNQGEQKSVQLVEIVGNRAVYGLNDLTSGNIDEKRDTAISMAKEKGFKEV